VVVKAAGLVVAGALALACARADSPAAAVKQYCDALPRDPVRAFLLLGPELHRTHGLRIPLTAALRAAAAGAPPTTLPEAQVAWLDIWKDPWLRSEADGLRFELGTVREVGDAAEVRVHVAPDAAPPFDQDFELSRAGTHAAWRIVAITQSGVSPANAGPAFAAAPSVERLLAAQRARAAGRRR
jgi:hypothetical protein